MKIIIIEDEGIALRKLKNIILEIVPSAQIIAELESVMDADIWLGQNNPSDADLIISDIMLSDGLAFDVFEKLQLPLPVIFTTAYDEYALRAFKTNGVDYLLKPIQKEELKIALDKFEQTRKLYSQTELHQLQILLTGLGQHVQHQVKPNFLVYHKDKIIPLPSSDISFFYTRNQMVYACLFDGKEYKLDDTLEEIEKRIQKSDFFRVNRQFIIAREAIAHAEVYFNNRLIITVNPMGKEKIIVSREKVSHFKDWLRG